MFAKESYSTFTSFRYIDYDSIAGERCSLNISLAHPSNKNAKDYLEYIIYIKPNDTYSGILEKEINDQKWYYATVESKKESSFRYEYYYATIYQDYIYEVNFSILSINEPVKCLKAHNTIEKSLKFK